ncbi:MAG: nucleotidyltransferase domain-containing protein [Planctomycetes bacterium]|nr:nucleotidyltransferase domain-containing protein [Planctomycetota bacterium]
MATTVTPPWVPTADRLRTAVERLVAASRPRQIILFGSYARGDADDHSDIDLLVVEPAIDDRYEEMIRLNRALKGLVMPVDLLVVSEQEFEHRSATPGTIEYVARREGRVLYAG